MSYTDYRSVVEVHDYQRDARREQFLPDPVYFPLMRRICELVLADTPIEKVLNMANDERDFRTPMSGRTGGNHFPTQRYTACFAIHSTASAFRGEHTKRKVRTCL